MFFIVICKYNFEYYLKEYIMNKKDIGRQLKHFRQIAGLTQEALAEKVNIHEKQISRIEAGIHFPTFDNFMKILDALNIEMKDFKSGNEHKAISKSKEKLLQIINLAEEKEVRLYLSVIQDLQKYLKINSN